MRDRLRALAEALWRARQDAWLVGAGTLDLLVDVGTVLRFDRGALTRAGDDGCCRHPPCAPLPA